MDVLRNARTHELARSSLLENRRLLSHTTKTFLLLSSLSSLQERAKNLSLLLDLLFSIDSL